MSKKKSVKIIEDQSVTVDFEDQSVTDQIVTLDHALDQTIDQTIDQAMSAMVNTKTVKTVKTVKTGVGKQILQLISDGVLSNKEIVAKVLVDNPLRKTTYACVAWYKSQVSAGKIDLPKPMDEVMMTEKELADSDNE